MGDSITLDPNAIGRDDIFMLNYTSGTTGDSKGVKCSHWGLLSSALISMEFLNATDEDVMIDYLPAPHGFDQFLFTLVMLAGMSMGYYQGNPLKLVEDCAALQPTIFPSVPRLYNKIYGRIKGQFDAATGCKGWLLNKGYNAKQINVTELDVA